MAFFLLINLSSRLHRCCQSNDRYAESTRKILVPEHIQRGRNFRRFEAGRRYIATAEITSVNVSHEDELIKRKKPKNINIQPSLSISSNSTRTPARNCGATNFHFSTQAQSEFGLCNRAGNLGHGKHK